MFLLLQFPDRKMKAASNATSDEMFLLLQKQQHTIFRLLKRLKRGQLDNAKFKGSVNKLKNMQRNKTNDVILNLQQ
jgi:hypothetical protein